MSVEGGPVTAARPKSDVGGLDYFALIFAAALWGGGVVASKLASDGLPSFTAGAMRTAIATCVFIPLVLFFDPGRPKLTWRDFWSFFGLGAFGFFGFNVIYFVALQQTTASHSALAMGASPIMTGLLSAFLIGERLRLPKIVGIAITTFGVVVIVASTAMGFGGDATIMGDVLILVGQLSWIVYTVYAKSMMTKFSPMAVTAFSCFFGAALLAPVALFTDFTPDIFTNTSVNTWLSIGYSGTASMTLAYILWNVGIKKIGATRTAVFSNLSPIFGVVFSAFVIGESITIYHLVAGVLIIGGVWLTNRT